MERPARIGQIGDSQVHTEQFNLEKWAGNQKLFENRKIIKSRKPTMEKDGSNENIAILQTVETITNGYYITHLKEKPRWIQKQLESVEYSGGW